MAIAVSQAYKDVIRGPIDRSQLKVEVYFSGALGWVDISQWVEQASGEKEEGSDKGTASTNTLNLTLINDDSRFSAKNSAGPYYGNLTPNKPIRVSKVWGSESVRLFTGYTGPWPTQAKTRTCQIQAQDAARLLLRKDIREETVFNPAALAAGYYLTPVLERAAWLSGLRWDAVTTKPDLAGHAWAFASHDGTAITVTKSAGAAVATYTLAGQLVMQLDLVDLLIPVAPLKGKALAVLDQLAKVVDGRVYFESQGQLVFRARMYRNDSTVPSVETFTIDNLDDVLTDQGFEGGRYSPLINKAEVTSTPYTFRLDAGGQVLEEEIPFKGDLFAKYHFNPGESYPASGDADLWCELPSELQIARTGSYPTAANVILESASGADRTKRGSGIRFKAGYPVFEQRRMKVAFENVGTEAEVIKTLTLKARLMRPVQRCRGVTKNQASIDLYDQRDWTYNNDLIPHATGCKNQAAWKVEDGREPKLFVTLKGMHGVPWLEINDRITVSETLTKSLPVAEDFIVKRIKWVVALAAFTATIEACSPSPDFTASALPPAVAIVETSNQNMNGAEQASLPPQVIDGTQALVGLNNIPAFAEIVNKVKNIKIAGSQSTHGIAFDGSDIYVTDWAPSKVYKLDSLTGQLLATQSLTLNSYLGFMAVGKSSSGATLLYVVSALGKIYVIDVKNFETGAFSVKADLSAAGYNPSNIAVAHGKLYVTATTSGSIPHLLVWDDITITQQNVPSKSIQLFGSAASPTQMAWDRDHVYIPLQNERRICRYKVAANTLDNGYAILGADVGIVPGDGIIGLTHDGSQLWAVAFTGKVVRIRDAVSGVSASQLPVDLSGGGYARFDGTYVWVSASSGLVQFSTSGGIVARYDIGDSALGSITFDGAAIWATSGAPLDPFADSSVIRVPRQSVGRQF